MSSENVKEIVIIGAGLMGHNAAQIALMSGYKVIMVDIKQEFIDKGTVMIQNGLKKLEIKGKLGEGVSANDLLTGLKTSLDLTASVKSADFAIEAVVEDMNIKKH